MKSKSPQPNIIWLLSDHQLYGNRSPLAQSLPLQAKMAKEGIRFTQARSVLPICSPARASMLNGLYPHAHGLTENDGRFGGRAGLHPGDKLIHQALLQLGYRCGWFGKWHVDNERPAADYGFEGFSLPGYGYPYSTDTYQDYLQRYDLPSPVATVEMPGESGLPTGTRVALTEAESWFDYEAGTALLDTPLETHEASFVASLASEWLEKLGDEPFFLQVDTWGPHPPYCVAEPFTDTVNSAQLELSDNFAHSLMARPWHHRDYQEYWHNILGLDQVGWQRMCARALEQAALVEHALLGVIETLERLGLKENTLILFSADHGDAVGSNGGIANKGGLLVEETLRIPLLASGVGIAAGTENHSLVSNMDLAATVLDMCGVADDTLHAKSLRPILQGNAAAVRDGWMAQHYGLHQHAIQRAWYQGKWKYVLQADGFEELYNLTVDPCERVNLVDELGQEAVLQAMRVRLYQEMVRYGDFDTSLFDWLKARV